MLDNIDKVKEHCNRELKTISGKDSYLAQRLQTSQAWSGTQKVPGLHWHLVSVVVVQGAVWVSSVDSQVVRKMADVSLFVKYHDNDEGHKSSQI